MDTDELEQFVSQSKSLIKSSPQMDEQNTRRKLIEPLLEVLGWNMISEEVELEYSVKVGSGTKKVDYALIIEETPVVLVEAKGLDTSLSQSHRDQLGSYMRLTGVDWGLLTNGEDFQVLKRVPDAKQPSELVLGEFDIDGVLEHIQLLQALSCEVIDTEEADRIAENIESTRRAINDLRKNKDEISDKIAAVVTDEVGESVSQQATDGAKQFVDALADSLEQQRSVEPDIGGSRKRIRQNGPQSTWTPQEGANAIAGTISRSELVGNTDDIVAVFPTKRSGVKFLKENNAWGFVRIGRDPTYVAMYVSGNTQQVKYVAKVQDIVSAKDADLARSLDAYYESGSEDAQAGFDPAKKVITFEPNSLMELSDPIDFGSEWPQSLRYTTLEELKNAAVTDDIL